MIDAYLTRRNASVRTKITVKSLISSALVVLAVVLPRLVHIALGASGGIQWLPMYLPVLLGGCILGVKWGLGAAVLSPIVSFALTAVFGNPMPALARLPYMAVELAVFAAVSGLFSGKIAKNPLMAFPAVLSAAVAGRGAFLLVAWIFQSVSPLSAQLVWLQIQAGLAGLVLQAALVPVIVAAVSLILAEEKK